MLRLAATQHAWTLYSLALASLLFATGCSADKPPAARPSGRPLTESIAGIRIKLLVTDDPEMAESIRSLRGEWEGSTSSELEVVEMTAGQLLGGERLDADCVIFANRDLGILAERGWIMPLPEDFLRQPSLAWQEVFEAAASHDASWSSTVYGVPLGSPVFVCAYRADLLKRLGLDPPRTWDEYRELAGQLSAPQPAAADQAGDWSGAMEPLADGWAGLTLLARAAAYARHRDQYSTWFDIQSMEPLISAPPMVRALDDLAAAYAHGTPDQLDYGPDEIWTAFYRGQAGLAITWPRALGARTTAQVSLPEGSRIGFVELPGSDDVYSLDERQWQKRRADEQPHVTLVGVAGRIASASRSSKHPEAALRLLAWLSGPKWSDRVAAASGQTALFRESHLSNLRPWLGPNLNDEAAHIYSDVVRQALQDRNFVSAPRIAGHDRYLAALDDAVHLRLRGETDSETALRQAADRWREITGELGLEAQRSAYRHSLGLE